MKNGETLESHEGLINTEKDTETKRLEAEREKLVREEAEHKVKEQAAVQQALTSLTAGLNLPEVNLTEQQTKLTTLQGLTNYKTGSEAQKQAWKQNGSAEQVQNTITHLENLISEAQRQEAEQTRKSRESGTDPEIRDKLNKRNNELKDLWRESREGSFLNWVRSFEKKIKKQFEKLKETLSSNDYRVFKGIFNEEIATEVRDEFFAELEAEKLLLVSSAKDFNQSPYLCEINATEENLLDEYLQKIFKNIVTIESKFKTTIEKGIPTDYEELKNDLDNLQQLDPFNHDVESKQST